MPTVDHSQLTAFCTSPEAAAMLSESSSLHLRPAEPVTQLATVTDTAAYRQLSVSPVTYTYNNIYANHTLHDPVSHAWFKKIPKITYCLYNLLIESNLYVHVYANVSFSFFYIFLIIFFHD